MTSIGIPDLGSPAMEPQTGEFSMAWANWINEIHSRVGVAEGAIADASSTVSAAPMIYDQTWGGEVVTAISDLQSQLNALLAVARTKGQIET